LEKSNPLKFTEFGQLVEKIWLKFGK